MLYSYMYVIFADQEYVSSLPLQMALYFNLFYFPVWITAEIVMLVAKVKRVAYCLVCRIHLCFRHFHLLCILTMLSSSVDIHCPEKSGPPKYV